MTFHLKPVKMKICGLIFVGNILLLFNMILVVLIMAYNIFSIDGDTSGLLL